MKPVLTGLSVLTSTAFFGGLSQDTVRAAVPSADSTTVVPDSVGVPGADSGGTYVPAGANVIITFERQIYKTPGPAYRITINRKGNVYFDGKMFVEVRGVRVKKINPEPIEALIKRFEEADYLTFKDNYPLDMAAQVPPFLIVTSLTVDGNTKTVRHSPSDLTAPLELLELERAIEEVADVEVWIRGK